MEEISYELQVHNQLFPVTVGIAHGSGTPHVKALSKACLDMSGIAHGSSTPRVKAMSEACLDA